MHDDHSHDLTNQRYSIWRKCNLYRLTRLGIYLEGSVPLEHRLHPLWLHTYLRCDRWFGFSLVLSAAFLFSTDLSLFAKWPPCLYLLQPIATAPSIRDTNWLCESDDAATLFSALFPILRLLRLHLQLWGRGALPDARCVVLQHLSHSPHLPSLLRPCHVRDHQSPDCHAVQWDTASLGRCPCEVGF